jgi:predicted glycosyltransferase
MTFDSKTSRLRILIHVLHGQGVGNFVRPTVIAMALARRHDVILTDGGRPVPRANIERVTLLPLPRIARKGSEFFPLEGGLGLDAVMQARQQSLRDTIGVLRPDIVVVESYPFTKWALGDEILDFANASRMVNPAAKVICSVREIHPRTRWEAGSDESYAGEVTGRLRAHFDALLIHGDPAFTRLDEHLPFVSATGLSFAYTGIVSEKPSATPPDWIKATTKGAPFILANVGGGVDRSHLLRHVLDAWESLAASGALVGWKLVLSPGLSGADDGLVERTRRHGDDVILRRFGPDFLAWLQAADLSVSCAGYNTCANLLETRRRAVLVPDPEMDDQTPRAMLLAARDLAVVVPSAELDRAKLETAILKSLAGPYPDHSIALDGAERTRLFIEQIAANDDQIVTRAHSI